MPENTTPSPIPGDMTFQERSWLVERIGWAAMGLFVLLALCGIFFSGPLSDTRATTADGAVVVEYHRFARRTVRGHFTIRLAAPLAGDTVVRIGPAFVRTYDIETLHPQPLGATAGTAGLEFEFVPSSAGDLIVEIGARARRFGILDTEIAVQGRGSVSIRQVIYP